MVFGKGVLLQRSSRELETTACNDGKYVIAGYIRNAEVPCCVVWFYLVPTTSSRHGGQSQRELGKRKAVLTARTSLESCALGVGS